MFRNNMNTYFIELIKILELLSFKFIEWDHSFHDTDNNLTEITLYQDDFPVLGMTYHTAAKHLNDLEKSGKIMIDYIGDPLKFDHTDGNFDPDDIVNGVLRIPVYNLILSSAVYEYLDQLKSGNVKNIKESENPTFINSESLLCVKKYKIKIALQDKITNDHKVLDYMLNKCNEDLYEEFQYVDIAKNEFDDLDYLQNQNSWKRYHTTCKSINDKINSETKGKIHDFLIFNTGKAGKVRINGKYLNSQNI